MSFTGHKTRIMFDRYNILNTGDQQRALALLEAKPMDTISVPILQLGDGGKR
jgi:hypothetical protein